MPERPHQDRPKLREFIDHLRAALNLLEDVIAEVSPSRLEPAPLRTPMAVQVVINHHKDRLIAQGFMTPKEIKQFLKISQSAVYDLIHTGSLPHVPVGRVKRVPRQAVLDYLREQMQGASVENRSRG